MSTAKEVMDKIASKLKANPEKTKGVEKKIAINLTGEEAGRWLVDCTQNPAQVKLDANTRADMTVTMAADDMQKMIQGDLDPQTAFLTGKVKIDGDLGLALKLGKILG
ncbi:MAG: SCP2 sterol-binding domain-containing protein [Pseudomonadota bacterium]